MTTLGKPVPERLKQDAIIEVVFEMRFDMETIPEVLFGQLTEYAPWKGFDQQRLPAYEIPAPIRQADANLRYQPVFALISADRHRAVRVGAQVLSYHQMAPYEGWDVFHRQAVEAIEGLFARAKKLTVRRLGLRYVNALTPALHRISSIAELNLTITIAEEIITDSVNINFNTPVAGDTRSTVRLATSEFVQGVFPRETSVVIDVDAYTFEGFKTSDDAKVREWIESAHTLAKQQFFRLLTQETIDALRED